MLLRERKKAKKMPSLSKKIINAQKEDHSI